MSDPIPDTPIFFHPIDTPASTTNNIQAVLTAIIYAICGSLLWDLTSSYLLTPTNGLYLAIILFLTLLIDPQSLAVLGYPLTRTWQTQLAYTRDYKPTFGFYLRTIFFLQLGLARLVCKFVVDKIIPANWFDLVPEVCTGLYFLKMVMGVCLPCILVVLGWRHRRFIHAVCSEILLKVKEVIVGVFRQCMAIGRTLGLNITVSILVLFVYLTCTGILTAPLNRFALAMWNKWLLAASETLMGVSDVLFGMTNDRVVYKGVVIRYI